MLWNCCQLFQCLRATVFLVKHETHWHCCRTAPKSPNGARTDPCKQLCQIDMSLRSHPCLEIGEFLNAKTPIFFKIVFFPRIFNIFNFYKEQLTSNEVSSPAAILFSSRWRREKTQTRFKLILDNNTCAVIRDKKTKNRAETSTRCLTARVKM